MTLGIIKLIFSFIKYYIVYKALELAGLKDSDFWLPYCIFWFCDISELITHNHIIERKKVNG